MDKIEKKMTAYANKHLLGRSIAQDRYLNKDEAEHLGWDQRSLLLELDNGTIVFMSQDDEGNNGGTLFGMTTDEELTFSVLW